VAAAAFRGAARTKKRENMASQMEFSTAKKP